MGHSDQDKSARRPASLLLSVSALPPTGAATLLCSRLQPFVPQDMCLLRSFTTCLSLLTISTKPGAIGQARQQAS